MKKKLNKKGGLFDILLAMVLSFILVVCLVIFMYAQGAVHDKLIEQAPSITSAIHNSTNVTLLVESTVGAVGSAYQNFKWISIALIIGYFLGVLLSAFLVKTHPAWFIAYILFAIITIVISVYISNTYETLITNEILMGTWGTFVGANYIFAYLPIWIAIISFIAGTLMYVNMDIGERY